jgi:transposase
MAYEEITALLGGWPGFQLVGVRREEGSGVRGAPRIILELEAVAGAARYCSRCGHAVDEVHDVTPRWVRDLPILEADTWLRLPRARLKCPRCGPTVEAVAWLDRYARLTTRFVASIARLCQVLPVKHVAAWFGLGWDTVKQIDARTLAARLGPIEPTLEGVRVIAIDEFAIQRGHRYATVVVEPASKRVLWVGRGRSREDLRAFFTLLGPARSAAIEAVVTDMSPAYVNEVRQHCPQAALVYDLFHVIARYGREVIDRVRVDQTNRLRRARGDHERTRTIRRVIKGARWLLLRNREHVTAPADRIRLRELLRANRPLFIVYVLKDDLKALWRYRYLGAARRAWAHWLRRARASRIPALIRFARNLAERIDGVLNHCRYPLHTGLLEGINNKIKVLKRMAYGFRDEAYFFLKIRAAFPGIPG